MHSINAAEGRSLLLLVAGAKGAIGSTVAAATLLLKTQPDLVLPNLISQSFFPYLGPPQAIEFAGWDSEPGSLSWAVSTQGVLPELLWQPLREKLDDLTINAAPDPADLPHQQVEQINKQIGAICADRPNALPVFINLLPAARSAEPPQSRTLDELMESPIFAQFPDLAYVIAAVESGIPVVNFTPNCVEVPAVVAAAEKGGVPIAGRDGKTGQTYLKVVMASALKARALTVDGWYSLNILGNADGANLMDPEKAAGKLANKTNLLTDILGYAPGGHYDAPAHKVHIDYYPPRGDAKEAWDVIDFKGIFDLPMSLRMNLIGRDSVLAAPMVIDLGRWSAALQLAGRGGQAPELGFFFKRPLGENPPLTFQEQLHALDGLVRDCDEAVVERGN